MTTAQPPLDSAIPQHLIAADRRPPKHAPGSYTPPYPSFSARFGEEVEAVVMASFGVQAREAEHPLVAAALRSLADGFGEADGPRSRDRARYVDGEGFTTTVDIAYWSDPAAFERWYDAVGARWIDPDRASDGIGFFAEIVQPTTDRFETIFSAADRAEGVAAVAGSMSGMVEEHAYWGAMRDRLPVSQHSDLSSSGVARLIVDGPVRTVVPHENACMIRSGQDIEHTGAEERAMYLETVEPVLRAGMDFLRDEGGDIGCYDNRYMVLLDEDDQPTDRTFGLSWWVDLASLETWAKSHPTHLEIFGAAMRHLSTFGPETRLRLHHEVTVAAQAQQRFTYVGCHDRTGMLRAVL